MATVPPAARRRALALAAALLLPAACERGRPADAAPAADAAAAVEAVDDAGRTVRLPRPAARVVSLVPSVTDVVVAVGGAAQLVGRTRYDTDGALAALPSVGGGVDPSVEALLALRPELVFAWEHDERSPLRQQLENAGVAVFAVRTTDTADVYRAIARVGRLLGRDSAAAATAAAARAELDAVRRSVAGRPPVPVLYVVGTAPPMTAGPRTFVGELLGVAGARSVFDDATQPWPTVAIEEIVRRQPAVLIVPVGETPATSVAALRGSAGWRELRAVREGRIVPVPVEVFGRPGPAMGRAARLLRDALHPDAR